MINYLLAVAVAANAAPVRLALIEDTPTRWHAYPAAKGAEVDVQASA